MNVGRLILGAAMTSILVAAIGCEAPTAAPASVDAATPKADIRVRSSSLVRSATGVDQWRVYRGVSQTVVMGFGKDSRPLDGVRIRYAQRADTPWVYSIEMLDGKRSAQLTANGAVVKSNLATSDIPLVAGASRIISAWQQGAGSDLTTKSFGGLHILGEGVDTDGPDCAAAAGQALMSCGPVALKCGQAALRGGQVLGPWGAAGMGAICLARNAKSVRECAKDAAVAASTCSSALQSKEGDQNPKPPEADETKPGEQTPATDPKPGEQSPATDPKPGEQTLSLFSGPDAFGNMPGDPGYDPNNTAAAKANLPDAFGNTPGDPGYDPDNSAAGKAGLPDAFGNTPGSPGYDPDNSAAGKDVLVAEGDADPVQVTAGADPTDLSSEVEPVSLSPGQLHIESTHTSSSSLACGVGRILKCGKGKAAVYCICKH